MPGVIGLLTRLILFGLGVFPSAFYTLLAEPDDLLLASFTSLYNVRLGLMAGSTLRLVAGHFALLVFLGSCNSLLWFVRHN